MAKPRVAGELFQMAWLLESLARTDLLEYPFRASHTGENNVPDFQLVSGRRRIAVEMTKVTTQNLEHARSFQAKLPDPPSHFSASNICCPESFARKLKAGRDAWSIFVAGRLALESREWLLTWNGRDKVPEGVKSDLVVALNCIIDGPPMEGDPALAHAHPRPVLIKVEGFPGGETARDRKSWLEDAFWEELAVPLNSTLMVSPFIRQDDTRMTRKEVVETGFLVPAMGIGGPTLEEEHRIWIERVFSEVEDKSTKLAGDGFCHGDEDWLVLWDRLGSEDWQLPARAEAISTRLAPCWKSGWFSRVFVQDEYFRWQIMFTAEGSCVLGR